MGVPTKFVQLTKWGRGEKSMKKGGRESFTCCVQHLTNTSDINIHSTTPNKKRWVCPEIQHFDWLRALSLVFKPV